MSSLSVIILSWNQAETTLACLARVGGWTRLRPRVWVVDNASTDGSRERIAAAWPSVRLMRSERNLGFGGGNNLALREVGDDDVLLLNNDAAVAEEDVLKLLATLELHPDAAIVGPAVFDAAAPARLLSAGGRDISTHVATHVRTAVPAGRAAAAGEPCDVDYVPGAVALLRASALARVGLLDERYFFGGELADWCERARRAGYRVLLEPGCSAYHDTRVSATARETLYPYYILRNRFLYIRRFRRAALPLFLAGWTAYGLFTTGRAALAGRRRESALLARALRDGILGRTGPMGAQESL